MHGTTVKNIQFI